MATPVARVLVELPLAVTANAKTIVHTCQQQSTLIKQCSAYPLTQGVQTTVTDLDTAVAALAATNDKIDNLAAQLSALKKTRTQQIGTVCNKHDNVVTSLNNASDNDPAAAEAWVGKTKQRAKPAPASESTLPPAGALLESLKTRHGSVRATCTAEPGAVSYLFQTGSDPAHPEAWAPPAIAHGHTFTVNDLPIGQPFYMRVAIVRRGSVQSQWTDVLKIVVK